MPPASSTDRQGRQQRNGTGRPVATPVPFARTSALAPFVDLLNTIGAPTARWLREVRISAGLLDDPESLVSLRSAYRFIELAARREHLEDLGVIVGQRVSAFELGAFGEAMGRAATLYEYLQTGVRLMGELSSQGTRLWLTTEGGAVRVNQYLSGYSGLGRLIADIYTLVVTVSMLRRFIGPAWSPREVRLLRGGETLLGDRSVFGDAALIPGQRHSSFTISHSLMDAPLPERGAKTAPRKYAWRDRGPQMPADFVGSVEQLIVSLLGDGYPSVQTAAAAAGVSLRTLQRRLADAGVTYSDLVAASRIKFAKDWLCGSDMAVAEIAATLGYTDASNFARAFRRQTGMSPIGYRRSRARQHVMGMSGEGGK